MEIKERILDGLEFILLENGGFEKKGGYSTDNYSKLLTELSQKVEELFTSDIVESLAEDLMDGDWDVKVKIEKGKGIDYRFKRL